MKSFFLTIFIAAALLLAPRCIRAQDVHTVHGLDERYKVDILVVVAHPDDEGGATPYLARAIYDLHKRVGVVYATRGGSGGNDYSREHGTALANMREMEAREACGKLGIRDVWFLDGKDTASQNVLNSLSSWGHGNNLEKLTGLMRLTRPEVVITWLPGIFAGENHGDHQASGVLATEAFDLAGDPVAFPAQVAGASKRLEPYLENLTPWQPKKIYFFSDAHDQKPFAGSGPTYSIKEISPSQKKPYWRLALDAALPHETQFPAEINGIAKMSDAEIEKMMSDPNTGWWEEPMLLIFGKSVVGGAPTDDIFAGIQTGQAIKFAVRPKVDGDARDAGDGVVIGEPWLFYSAFLPRHGLASLPKAKQPEIAVKTGTMLYVPFVARHSGTMNSKAVVKVNVPTGWKIISGQGEFLLPAEPETAMRVDLEIPSLSADELKKLPVQEISVGVQLDGKPAGEVNLHVQVKPSALPQ
jgi:LmbE family N-acetylglucosaminyl deacetylase